MVLLEESLPPNIKPDPILDTPYILLRYTTMRSIAPDRIREDLVHGSKLGSGSDMAHVGLRFRVQVFDLIKYLEYNPDIIKCSWLSDRLRCRNLSLASRAITATGKSVVM